MTIILFLVDTSASMCQKAYVNGVQKSYLDIAKGAVETFLKYRQRSQDCMGDRYMLLTFEDPPSNVKAGWKENHATFMNELKNLQSNGLTSMGEALRNAFDLLNLNRMQSGIDTYGQGRCPFYLEPSVIIVISDGGKYAFKNGVHQEIILPLNTHTTGAKLTKEPFRWDQRLFSLVLRMAGNKLDERIEGKVPHDDSPIEKMCEVTGGRSYRVKSHYVLNQCIESLVQKVQPGVVVHFEQQLPKELKDGEVLDIAFVSQKKMIYVQKHPTQKSFPVGFWPIPEPYWPDPKANNLPPRDAHPKIRIISPCVDEPLLVRNFPVDKYEVEPSPLTLAILSKRDSTKCWPVIVSNGVHGGGGEQPFGYLKATCNFSTVHLIILPYNYLTLLPLLNDLFQKYNQNPPPEWVNKFNIYTRCIPPYYGPFLRRALVSANLPFHLLQYLLPDNLDSYLSLTVANYLKTMKTTAKQEQENMCMRVFKQLKLSKPPYHQVETTKLNSVLPLKRELVTHPQLKETFSKLHCDIAVFDNYTIFVPSTFQQSSAKNYRNPFDVPRRDLIDEIARMRENFLKLPTTGINMFTKDAGHCLPISEMGNYQEYLKNKQSPLREIEPTNVRQHMFGNPYKKDKHMVMVDEADLGDVAPMKSPNSTTSAQTTKKNDPNSVRARKRKAGPIRRDYVFQRLTSISDDSSSSCGDISSCSNIIDSQLIFDNDDRTNDSVFSSNVDTDDEESNLIIDFTDEPSSDYVDIANNGPVQEFLNEMDPMDYGAPIALQIPPMLLNTLPSPVPASLRTTPPTPPLPISMLFSTTNFSCAQPPPIVTTISTSALNTLLTPCSVPQPQTNVRAAATATDAVVPSSVLNNGNLKTHSHHNHNNDHEALAISKILQQCTNGQDRLQSTSSSPIVHQNKHLDCNNYGPPDDPMDPDVPAPVPPQHFDNPIKTEAAAIAPATATFPAASAADNVDLLPSSRHLSPTTELSINYDDDDYECDDQKENIRQHNREARCIIFKDIRRPGRDYSSLLKHLNSIQGSLETRHNFVQMCIKETMRFRRRNMADCIQEWWEKQFDNQFNVFSGSSNSMITCER